MPGSHARLSPSSSHRWLHCTPSVVLSEKLAAAYPEIAAEVEASSPYAEEGTAAHALAEIFAQRRLGWVTDDALAEKLLEWEVEHERSQVDDDFAEMAQCCWEYADFIFSLAGNRGTVFLEQRVDPRIPECYGTADAIVVGTNKHLHVVDMKYGEGLFIEAANNPQLMAYGVGALEDFGEIFDEVEWVTLTVFQPRLDNVASWTISVEDLRAWREKAAETARVVLAGGAEFAPSEETCQWCPAKSMCRARMEAATSVDFGVDADLMSPQEIADVLPLLDQMQSWIKDVRAGALELALHRGVKIPGYRLGTSSTRRYITNPAGLADLLTSEYGLEYDDVMEVKPRALGALEKKLGKARFAEIAEPYLAKTEAKPKLVPVDDKSPDWDPDFEVIES